MHCNWAIQRIGRYIDFELGFLEKTLLRFHLSYCATCHAHYEESESLGGWLGAVPDPAPPASLEFRILSAFSIEAQKRRDPGIALRKLKIRLSNLVRPVAVPAVGGVLLALVLVPAMLSAFWAEPTASADDVPLRFLAQPLVTAPFMTLPSPYPVARDYTVTAYIDERGGVYDFRVEYGGPLEGRMRGELASALLTTKFKPAQRFGRPMMGQRVILFQRIDSKS